MTHGSQHDANDEPPKGPDADEGGGTAAGNLGQSPHRTQEDSQEARLQQLALPTCTDKHIQTVKQTTLPRPGCDFFFNAGSAEIYHSDIYFYTEVLVFFLYLGQKAEPPMQTCSCLCYFFGSAAPQTEWSAVYAPI